jgi:hypothetical protein
MVAETLELAGDYSQNKQNACCVFPQPTLNVHVNIILATSQSSAAFSRHAITRRRSQFRNDGNA